jgi:hypothetical protein
MRVIGRNRRTHYDPVSRARRPSASPSSLRSTQPSLRSARPRRPRTEGSALALVPAGFLVLILLAAIAVDSAVAFLGQRQLGDALAAAANDAAAAAVSDSTFYGSGQITIDPSEAATVVCESMAAQRPNLQDIQVSIAVAGSTIAVRATAQVQEVFGRVLPGLHTRQVSASASAQADEGPASPGPAPSAFVAAGC